MVEAEATGWRWPPGCRTRSPGVGGTGEIARLSRLYPTQDAGAPGLTALPSRRYADPWEALYAFYLEHRLCSGLDGGVEGERVWMTCDCGGCTEHIAPPIHRDRRGRPRSDRVVLSRPQGLLLDSVQLLAREAVP